MHHGLASVTGVAAPRERRAKAGPDFLSHVFRDGNRNHRTSIAS